MIIPFNAHRAENYISTKLKPYEFIGKATGDVMIHLAHEY